MVAKALVCQETGMFPLRIMNINKEPCFVCKNMVAATFEPVEMEPFPLVISKVEILTPT